MLFFDANGPVRATCSDVDAKGGDAIGDKLGHFGFLEVKQVAFFHVLQVVQRGFQVAHQHLNITVRVTDGNGQVFAPYFVRLLIAIASLYSVGQELALMLERVLGVL